MSSSHSPEDGKNSPGSPQKPEVNVPPINLPKPDIFDTRKSNEGRNTFEKKQKPEKGKRRHPLDPYRDERKKAKGCCAGLFCLVLFFVVLTGSLSFYAGRALLVPLREKHEVVRLHGAEEIIAAQPSVATLYVAPGSRVVYQASATAVPVSIVAREIEISGVFSDDVILRALKTSCQAGARFEKDVDILTIQFRDGGMVVNGTLKGKTFQRDTK